MNSNSYSTIHHQFSMLSLIIHKQDFEGYAQKPNFLDTKQHIKVYLLLNCFSSSHSFSEYAAKIAHRHIDQYYRHPMPHITFIKISIPSLSNATHHLHQNCASAAKWLRVWAFPVIKTPQNYCHWADKTRKHALFTSCWFCTICTLQNSEDSLTGKWTFFKFYAWSTRSDFWVPLKLQMQFRIYQFDLPS